MLSIVTLCEFKGEELHKTFSPTTDLYMPLIKPPATQPSSGRKSWIFLQYPDISTGWIKINSFDYELRMIILDTSSDAKWTIVENIFVIVSGRSSHESRWARFFSYQNIHFLFCNCF
jgi:hypothetical protein